MLHRNHWQWKWKTPWLRDVSSKNPENVLDIITDQEAVIEQQMEGLRTYFGGWDWEEEAGDALNEHVLTWIWTTKYTHTHTLGFLCHMLVWKRSSWAVLIEETYYSGKNGYLISVGATVQNRVLFPNTGISMVHFDLFSATAPMVSSYIYFWTLQATLNWVHWWHQFVFMVRIL